MAEDYLNVFGGSPLISIETWDEYRDPLHSWEYLHATAGIIQALEKKLEDAKSFDDLKRELTEFCSERRTFVAYAVDHPAPH